jgi:hypothetical protein
MAKKALGIQADDAMPIAPCGLDCRLCRAFGRDRRPCPGCRRDDGNKSNACVTCAIKNCEELAAGNYRFCFSCAKFPCADLLHLDRRYRTRYAVSAIANLERIKAVGVGKFVAEETAEWTCEGCGSLLCMHKPRCANCGSNRRNQ